MLANEHVRGRESRRRRRRTQRKSRLCAREPHSAERVCVAFPAQHSRHVTRAARSTHVKVQGTADITPESVRRFISTQIPRAVRRLGWLLRLLLLGVGGRPALASEVPATTAEALTDDVSVRLEPPPAVTEGVAASGNLMVPLALYTPETHVGIGGFFVHFFRLANRTDSRPSSLAVLGLGTTRRQFIMEIHHDLYLSADDLHVFGKLEYQRYPDSFWGIGNAAEDAIEERYDRERLRFRGGAQYRVRGPLYAGVGADLMLYRGVYTRLDGIFARQRVPGEDGGFTAGLGPTLTYDSRDNTLGPHSGWLLNAAFLYFGKPLGSRYDFVKTVIDARHYVAWAPDLVLGMRIHGEAHGGDVPYYQLAMLGGDDLLRGYYLGRYRDEALASFEIEQRFPIVWRFGGVAFAGVGAVAGAADELVGVPWRYAVGGGLRFALDRRERLNLRLDAGVGPDTFGLYVMVGEAF